MTIVRRVLMVGIVPTFLFLTSCGNPTWNADVVNFVENGLSNMGLADTVKHSDGSSISYLSSSESTTVRIELFNPQHLSPVTYTLGIDDPSLYEVPPVLTDVDYRTLTLPIDPTLAAEHQNLEFTLGIYVPALNRTYPDQRITFRCETAPNPPQALVGGTTDNDKAMIAFQIPQEATDVDIETIEIRWGPTGSEHSNSFVASDASLLTPPADGENLLGAVSAQNRYFYPSSAATGAVYAFNVTLIDASGRRSETRTAASDLVEYSLTYDANNAESGTAPPASVHEYGTSATIAGNTGSLVRSGYLFDGWNTEPDGTGTDYTPGQTVTMDAGPLALYAKWTQYMVYYMDFNGGVSQSPPAATGHAPGQMVTVPAYNANNPVDGYYFLGWDTDPALSTVVYEPGDTFVMPEANVNLYAMWAHCILSEADLRNITDFSADYYLLQNIVLTSPWASFIGVTGDPFTGRFFGNGNTISAVNIVETSKANLGLFGYLGSGGEIHDLSVSGSLDIQGCNNAGLLAGYSKGVISNCDAIGTIADTGTGNMDVGGLVGYSEDCVLEDCTVDVTINGSSDNVGGLVGHTSDPCSITNCSVDGSVSGRNTVGGLIGYFYDTDVDGCSVHADVSGEKYVGGIAGELYLSDILTGCTVSGSVSGTSGYIGGLIGYSHDSSIDDCTVTGSISAQDSIYVGGLIGCNWFNSSGTSTISNCSTTGSRVYVNDVAMTNSLSGFGGLIGYNVNTNSGTLIIENCFSTKEVTINSGLSSYVGGLIGYNENSGAGSTIVRACYAQGDVSGYITTGGLIGSNIKTDGFITIERCFASGDVTGASYIGGLIGTNVDGSVSECYASGSISASGYCAGLIVNNNGGAISNCYAAGDVNGSLGGNGGLIFENLGNLINCYSCGMVDGDFMNSCLVANNTGDASTCYYLKDVSAPGTVDGNPRTETDLRILSNYSGWDFANIWNISTGVNNGYPHLLYFYDRYGTNLEP